MIVPNICRRPPGCGTPPGSAVGTWPHPARCLSRGAPVLPRRWAAGPGDPRGGQKLTKIPPWKRSRGPNESGLWWIQVDPPQSHAGLPKGPDRVLWVPNGDEARAGPPAPCAKRVPCHKSAGFRFLGASPEQIPPRNEPVSKFLGKRLQLCAGGTGASRGGDREQWPGGKGHSGPRAPSGLHHLRGGFWGHPAPSGGLWGLPLSVWHPRGAPHRGAGAVPTCQGPPCTPAPRNGARLWDFLGGQPHGRVFWIGGAIPRHPTPIQVASLTVLPPESGADGPPVTSVCPPPRHRGHFWLQRGHPNWEPCP